VSTVESFKTIGLSRPDLVYLFLCFFKCCNINVLIVVWNLDPLQRTGYLRSIMSGCVPFQGVLDKGHNNCIRGKHLSSQLTVAHREDYGGIFS